MLGPWGPVKGEDPVQQGRDIIIEPKVERMCPGLEHGPQGLVSLVQAGRQILLAGPVVPTPGLDFILFHRTEKGQILF